MTSGGSRDLKDSRSSATRSIAF